MNDRDEIADNPGNQSKWVYLFSDVEQAEDHAGEWADVRGLLGGKGANLADMTRIGVPVPPGFTVTTEACNAYLAAGDEFPEGLWEQELAALRAVEKATGKKFGDPDNALLISCRSGAKFSMPGMMDTVLNIGLNKETIDGLIRKTEDARFTYDSYRRLVQMFGAVVMGVPDEPFEHVIAQYRNKRGVANDADLTAEDWKAVAQEFEKIIWRFTGEEFPVDPLEQLRQATEAVFKSWNGKRARDYRKAAGIPDTLGTAVNIQTMVFGNMGDDCATGVAMTRNGSTGEKKIEGDYLTNAQGEDVVAGIRLTKPIEELAAEMPEVYAEFEAIVRRLEAHYREMQDVEFTIEHGKLWMLQTRDGKRTAQAAVRIAVDLAEEGVIDRETAVTRVTPDQVDFFLHPQFSAETKNGAREAQQLLGKGLNVSPGAAVGIVAFTADLAEKWAEEGKNVIMVRPETKPDDVHGMLAANGILTSRGGRTSHAALVARQFGKPAVVGLAELDIDLGGHLMRIGDHEIDEGEWISIDGGTGELYEGQLETVVPDISDPALMKLLGWADEFRRLQVWANADYPKDAQRAREYGAQGIGLCRTEHMFFETERQPIVQKMIMADNPAMRREALDALLPMQREDFKGLFGAMDGQPVIIRLLDPPLHEFLPGRDELAEQIADHKIRLTAAGNLQEINELLGQISEEEMILERVEAIREFNPMLGTRGVRLGLLMPELTKMQVRAIFEAACEAAQEGIEVIPEIMIPLTSHVNEINVQRSTLEAVAEEVMAETQTRIAYKFGTMIEIPRAALTAGEIAEKAQFFSFGTNDLTQTAFGISRDDAERGFLIHYLEEGILPTNPFQSIDENGVGRLMEIAVTDGRKTRPDIEIGICGEHGGDPSSIDFCHRLGIDYVSCSPFRVPVARLAAAHAALNDRENASEA